MAVSGRQILAGMRLFQWLFPPTPLEEVSPLSLDELKAKYKWRDRWAGMILVLLFVGCGVGYFFLLDLLATWRYQEWSDARFLIRPSSPELGVWAGFLSLASVGFFGVLLFRLALGREEFRVYMAYTSRKSTANWRGGPGPTYNIPKAFVFISLVVFLPLAVLAVLRIDNYTVFTDKALIDSPFLSFGSQTVHPYTDVRGVYEVRGYHARFEDKFAPYQLIVFNDGTRWETPHGSGGAKLEEQKEIIKYVADRSGQTIRTVNFAEDITP